MYMKTEAEGKIRIPPSKLGEDINAIVDTVSREQFEGKMAQDRSLTILVDNVRAEGLGFIVHGDGAVYQTVKYDRLAYIPKDGEVVEGVVIDIREFGAFVRFGPLDGLLHVSQVMDDRVDIDQGNQRLIGKESGRTLAVGDKVKARIVSIAFDDKTPQDSKIGLTMRQPGLGRLDWIEADARKGEQKGGEE
ncbi:MAG: DNA-directed RNA polymerase [archaeon]|nr:DNA-directed RNA polymerase [archaeon]